MRERLAQLVSNTLNPFVISAIVIVLLAFEETSGTGEALKWSAISLTVSVLPVLAVVLYFIHRKKMDGFFTTTRKQRNIIYLISSIFGTIGCILLWFLKAPGLLSVTFTTGLISIIMFMGINHFWKISLHTAFTAASATIIIIIYGINATWTLIFIPVVAWARVGLKQHSLSQVGIGGLLAILIVLAIFWGFGKIGD